MCTVVNRHWDEKLLKKTHFRCIFSLYCALENFDILLMFWNYLKCTGLRNQIKWETTLLNFVTCVSHIFSVWNTSQFQYQFSKNAACLLNCFMLRMVKRNTVVPSIHISEVQQDILLSKGLQLSINQLETHKSNNLHIFYHHRHVY